jgi:hypothetical protein
MNTSLARSPTFLKNSWAAISISLSKRRWDCPPRPCLLGTRDGMDDETVGLLLLEHHEQRFQKELGIAPVEEDGYRDGRLDDELCHLRLVVPGDPVPDEEDDAVLRY